MDKIKILLVDDNAHFVKLCIEALKTKGFDASGETDPHNIRKLLRKRVYDIFLLDIRMPQYNYNGPDVLKDIMSNSLENKVIAISGAVGEVEETVSCFKLGAIDFVSKPFESIEDLVTRIKVNVHRPAIYLDKDAVRENVIQALYSDVQYEESSIKGVRLEQLMKLIFESVDGFNNVTTNLKTRSEEIDIEILNERNDAFWAQRGSLILAECKNWSPGRVVKRGDFDKFAGKLRRRHPDFCRLGFFISYSAFSKGFKYASAINKPGGALIVPIDSNGIHQLVESEDRESILKELVTTAAH